MDYMVALGMLSTALKDLAVEMSKKIGKKITREDTYKG